MMVTPFGPVKFFLTVSLFFFSRVGTGWAPLVTFHLTGISVSSDPGPGQRVSQVVLTTQGPELRG